MEETILSQAEAFVDYWFQEKMPSDLHYHNVKHTEEVVQNAQLIAEKAVLSEEETEELLLASWFHDTGFARARQGHESESVRIAREFLTKREYPAERIAHIEKLILATQMGVEADTLSEKIIQDADLSHLGSKKYLKRLKSLRKEWKKDQGEKYSDQDWYEMNHEFLKKHDFHTEAAKELFDKQKEENIQKTEELLKEAEEIEHQKAVEESNKEKTKEEAATTEGVLPKKKKTGSDRGIETMFRITMKNHIQLSQIADNKANIMLSINSVIISVVLSLLLPQIEDRPSLLIPTMVLLIFSVISVVLATVSTIPKVSRGNVTRQQIEDKQANLLFFGNFNDMPLKDFQWGMHYLMEERDYLYDSMIKDLYFLGKVLHRKYLFLRFTYGTFMFGTVISVLSFLIALSLES